MATTLMSRMIKKAASSSVIQLSNRRTPLRRNYTSSLNTSNNVTPNLSRQVSRATIIPTHQYKSCLAEKKSDSNETALAEEKSYSDETFLNVIESVIDCSEEKFHEFAKASKEFPFNIVDNAGETTITLTREYQGEEIKVTVYGPIRHYYGQEEEKDRDNTDDMKEEKSDPQYVYMYVSISKKNGLSLELHVEAHAADGIKIHNRLLLKNPNASHDYPAYEEKPDILDLDEKLQKAFHTYLEVRGFKPGIGEFLCEYMVQRKLKKHNPWLANLKNFSAN